MTTKTTAVEAQVVDGKETSLAQAGTTAMATSSIDFFEQLAVAEVQNKVAGIMIPEEEFLKSYMGDPASIAIGKKYHALRKKINSTTDDGAPWRPSRVGIASKRSDKHEAAFKAAGAGGLYETATDRAIPKTTKWFPLFAPKQENNLFKDRAVLACTSMDGEKGRQVIDFGGHPKNTVHVCGGATCPNMGYTNKDGQFTKNPAFYNSIPQDACQPDKVMYMVDENFTNIYKIYLRHYSIKPTYNVMAAAQKNETTGVKFDATVPGTTWWNLTTVEQTTQNGKSYYYKAEKTDAAIDEKTAKALLRLALYLEHDWFAKQRNDRDNPAQAQAQVADEAMAALDSSTQVDADGSSFTAM